MFVIFILELAVMFAQDRETNKGGMVNDFVIPRDTKLPCSVTKNYQVMFDDQKEIDCSVTQSEGEESDVEFVNSYCKRTTYIIKKMLKLVIQ